MSQREFHYKIPEGACAEVFNRLDAQQNVRNHYHVVVSLFKDTDELSVLSPNDIVENFLLLNRTFMLFNGY